MFLGGNSSGRAQPTISPRLLRPMCGMAQSSLRIALPKKPSGSAGRFWPNHRIHVLKAKALLFSSDYGRGFGSVFHHHRTPKALTRKVFLVAQGVIISGFHTCFHTDVEKRKNADSLATPKTRYLLPQKTGFSGHQAPLDQTRSLSGFSRHQKSIGCQQAYLQRVAEAGRGVRSTPTQGSTSAWPLLLHGVEI